MEFKARPYQLEAVRCVFEYWNKGLGNGNPVVVAPTGAGKSLIMAMLVGEAVKSCPSVRVIVFADQKELVEQDFHAYTGIVGGNAGVWSASVGKKDCTKPITFAQIQSFHGHESLFGRIDFAVVDEAHMISTKTVGRYREALAALKSANPLLKVVGFTATPYRLGAGYIYTAKDSLFSGVCYDISLDLLIKEGYLVPPVGFLGSVQADTDAIERNSMGEFKESSATKEFHRITTEAVGDMRRRTSGRHSILVFACSVEHANEIAETLRLMGEQSVAVVTGKTPRLEREGIVASVRSGAVRWCVNCGVFTKGFDARNIDAVVLLRATESAALFVQMVGRGLRTCEGKKDCMVLDYGGNVMRHGPINAVRPAPKREPSGVKRIMAKACVKCGALIAIGAGVCPHCGEAQPVAERDPNHYATPTELDILKKNDSVRWMEVLGVSYEAHVKQDRVTFVISTSLKVSYRVGLAEWVNEFVCPMRPGWAGAFARRWFAARGCKEMSVEDALKARLPKPDRILVDYSGKYPAVKDAHIPPSEFGIELPEVARV